MLQMGDLLRVATQLAAREEHIVQRAVRVRNALSPAETLDIAVGKLDLQAVHEPLIGNAVDREARDEGPLVLSTGNTGRTSDVSGYLLWGFEISVDTVESGTNRR